MKRVPTSFVWFSHGALWFLLFDGLFNKPYSHSIPFSFSLAASLEAVVMLSDFIWFSHIPAILPHHQNIWNIQFEGGGGVQKYCHFCLLKKNYSQDLIQINISQKSKRFFIWAFFLLFCCCFVRKHFIFCRAKGKEDF